MKKAMNRLKKAIQRRKVEKEAKFTTAIGVVLAMASGQATNDIQAAMLIAKETGRSKEEILECVNDPDTCLMIQTVYKELMEIDLNTVGMNTTENDLLAFAAELMENMEREGGQERREVPIIQAALVEAHKAFDRRREGLDIIAEINKKRKECQQVCKSDYSGILVCRAKCVAERDNMTSLLAENSDPDNPEVVIAKDAIEQLNTCIEDLDRTLNKSTSTVDRLREALLEYDDMLDAVMRQVSICNRAIAIVRTIFEYRGMRYQKEAA